MLCGRLSCKQKLAARLDNVPCVWPELHCIKRCGRDSNWDIASRDVVEIVTGTLHQEMW